MWQTDTQTNASDKVLVLCRSLKTTRYHNSINIKSLQTFILSPRALRLVVLNSCCPLAIVRAGYRVYYWTSIELDGSTTQFSGNQQTRASKMLLTAKLYFVLYVLLLLRESKGDALTMNTRIRDMCSRALSNLIFDICTGTLPVTDLPPESLSKVRAKRASLFSAKQRSRRQVADECCLRSCTVSQLVEYCPETWWCVQMNSWRLLNSEVVLLLWRKLCVFVCVRAPVMWIWKHIVN